MFTFFKRSSSSKHKCEDSRSASATPPPCTSRLPSSLLAAAGGGGGAERKAAKNKRVRFKFVSDHDEDEPRLKQRGGSDEELLEAAVVSASRSNQLHGNFARLPNSERDDGGHGYSGQLEERECRDRTASPEPPQHHNDYDEDDDGLERETERGGAGVAVTVEKPKPKSALNQLLERMAGKKNRYRGGSGGGSSGSNNKKAKHDSVQPQQQQQKRFNNNNLLVHPSGNKPENVVLKKCGDQDDYDDYDDDQSRRTTLTTSNGRAAKMIDAEEVAAAGKATAAFDFNASRDRNENRPEILHKITVSRSENNNYEDHSRRLRSEPPQPQQQQREHSSWFSAPHYADSDDDEYQEQPSAAAFVPRAKSVPEPIEKPSFRLLVNEQATTLEDYSSAPPVNSESVDNQAADFVRDLVLNRYKKKKRSPVSDLQDEIPTVIDWSRSPTPVVVEAEDEKEGKDNSESIKMGQQNSKANSPNPLEKSSSDGAMHPTVIITEEEVFYEAQEVEEIPHGIVVAEDDVPDDGILRAHSPSPSLLGTSFKTIHVSTEDLQDELEKEESEPEADSGLFNTSYNTMRNASGVTVVEIVDENNNGDSGSSDDDADSGCEETLRSSASPIRSSASPLRSSASPLRSDNGTRIGHLAVFDEADEDEEEDEEEVEEEEEEVEEEESDDADEESVEQDNDVLDTILRRRKVPMDKTESVSLPDVVESIGLPNVVVMHNASVKLNSSDPMSEKLNQNGHSKGIMTNGSSGGGGSVLHVDGKSQKSVTIRNIPIIMEEQASEEEESEKSNLYKGGKMINGGGGHSNHWDSKKQVHHEKKAHAFEIEEEQDSGFDCDKRDLVNQDALHSKSRVAELQGKLDELERDLSVKVWTIDRLQAELASATKEGECVRRKLKNQEEEMQRCRHRFEDNEDDLNRRYNDLEERYNETHQKLTSIQAFTSHLQVQLAEAQSDAEHSREEKEKLINERTEEEKIIKDALEQAIEERNQVEAKWNREFEQLRNFNQDREEHLMEDCEWKIRTMQKQCKEKLEKAESLKKEAIVRAEQMEEISKEQHSQIQTLKVFEGEVNALRGLTGEQRENLLHIMRQLEDVKGELEEANDRSELEIRNAQKIKNQCHNELLNKERYALLKIEEAKMQISIQWEQKLMDEMVRLKSELEAVHAEDRKGALEELKNEYTKEINQLMKAHKSVEESLREEIKRLKEMLAVKRTELMEAQNKADKQVVDTRIYVDRSDRTNQLLLDREVRAREELIDQMNEDRQRERDEMEEQFRERLQSVKDEFARELVESSQEVEAKYKRLLESQLEHFVAEKEELIQTAETRHRHKLKDMENQIRDMEISFQRERKDYETNHGIERSALEQREMQNSQEIDTLHRKCRCLTKLFEEMRMRYERREPRQEDIREIGELKERCDSQERDLARLTETLRQMQIVQEHHPVPPGQDTAAVPVAPTPARRGPAQNPGHCDVIYEEQEEDNDEEQSTATSVGEEEEESTCASVSVMD